MKTDAELIQEFFDSRMNGDWKPSDNKYQEELEYFIQSGTWMFNNCNVLPERITKIAEYLQKHNITNVIIGVSGGIDSAVVFAMLTKVKQLHIPSLKIRGYCITFNEVYGHVFNSSYIDLLRKQYCNNYDISITTIDCTNTLNQMFVDLQLNADEDQLLAQSSYAFRYQMLFTYAQRFGGITIGTTNKDEFDFVGWFGKNSDMVVDLQVITDWHKFEVVEAAKQLSVPSAIIERTPTGDLIDGSSDEANFGCTYNELAFIRKADRLFSDEFIKQKYEKAIALNRKNAHKYQGQTFNPVFIK